MATYTTEGNASTVLSVCRGLGIDNAVANNIRNTLNDHDMYTQLYGNNDKKIKPNNALIESLRQLDVNIEKYLLAISGLISGRSQHASGVVIFNNGYINDSVGMMKTKKGLDITSYNADEVEFLGGLKIDILSTDALTREMATLELLEKDNMIEKQETLRKTYDKYLHPNVLEYNDPKMYDMLYNGDVISVFQFSTNVGAQAIKTVNARSFKELSAANSLMRLTTKSKEQPIDKFARFRDNLDLWYQEMRDNKLTNEEIEVLEKHLKDVNGICDTQELLMEISMDVGGYTLTEANKFRKLVAKADAKSLEEEKSVFFDRGSNRKGSSKEFLEYVWEYCFKHQFSYSFSKPHIMGYSIIAIQEMNLCYKYSPLYWQAACMIVDSGSLGDSGQINYGSIARAVNNLDKITTPDINLSDRDFTPNRNDNVIMFGIQPIRNLTNDTIEKIFAHRPFVNYEDFHHRMVDTKLISPKQTVVIIKAGLFNRLEQKTSRDIMIQFVNMLIEDKQSLTLSSFPKIYENKLIDNEDYLEYYLLFMYRKKLKSKKEKKDKKFYDYFLNNYATHVDYIEQDGNITINIQSFDKFYDTKMETIRNIINSPLMLSKFSNMEKQEFWKENCMGSPQQWEIETISFFSKEHELDNMDLTTYFNPLNFNNMKDRDSGVIAGTVIDKDPQKNIVYITTQYGVVSIKIWKNLYNKYNEVITNGKSGKHRVVYEKSWFDIGNTLVFVGFRSGEQFLLSTKNTQHKTTIYKINGMLENGEVFFSSQRRNVNE